MNPIEQRVLNAIDMDALLHYLCELVAVRSVTGQENRAQQHVAEQMSRIDLDVDLWEVDLEKVRAHPAYSAEVERSHSLGVVGSMGHDRGGRSLILNGHVDVVPVADEANWMTPPWQGTIRDGRVYGRGSLDMKGGLCCALFAAQAIRDAGVQLQGRLLIESVVGEEDGGMGTLAAILRGYRADGAIVMEPTELMVAPAQAGALNFRITVPGRAAHGAMRDEGVSAIEKFILLYQALMDLERERNQSNQDPRFAAYALPYPICVGTIQAGIWASTVAESCTFAGRYGVAVDEEIASARRRLENRVAQIAQADPWLREHPPLVTWWGGQFAPAGIPEDDPIVQTLSAAYSDLTGKSPTLQGMPYGADMRLLVYEGQTPTLLFGPGDIRNAHRPNEYVPIADLEFVTRSLALTALRFCGYQA